MTPVSPVLPSYMSQPLETVFAKDQPEYIPLPVVRGRTCNVSRWKLSFRERLRILFTGNLWHYQMTHHKNPQPVLLSTIEPSLKDALEL